MNRSTLVILPGWEGSKETWKNFIILAQKDFEVVCIDLPCFGEEPCPYTVWGVKEYAEFVKQRLVSLKEKNIFLLGHSFGGQVACYLVAKEPNLVKKLILSGAAIFRPEKTLKRTVFYIIAKIGKAFFCLPVLKENSSLARKFLYKFAGSPDFAKASGIKQEIFKKVVREDISNLLPSISIPTLVVWGDKDKHVPLQQGKKIIELIPGSKLQMFQDCSHGIHLHKSEELLQAIKKFM